MRTSWSRGLVFAATLTFGVLFVLDLAACWVLLSPALLGLAACAVWFRWGTAGRRAGWLAAVLLVGTAAWYVASSAWLAAPEDAYEASLTPVFAEELGAGDEPADAPPDEIERWYAVHDSSAAYYSSEVVTTAGLVPGAGPVGATAAVLALVGVGLGRSGRSGRVRELRRPTWDVREIVLIVLAVLMVAVGGWTVPTGLGLAAVVLWLARVGPPGDRPRPLAGVTLGLLAAAVVLGVRTNPGAIPGGRAALDAAPLGELTGPPPVAVALLAGAFVLVATAPLATAARRVQSWASNRWRR